MTQGTLVLDYYLTVNNSNNPQELTYAVQIIYGRGKYRVLGEFHYNVVKKTARVGDREFGNEMAAAKFVAEKWLDQVKIPS